MTRLSVSDLNPRMRQQVLRKLAEEDKQSGKDLSGDALNSDQTDKSKYRAKKTTVVLPDGTEHTFDSAKEAKVYNELLIRLKAKEISNLRLQVPYVLIPKQIKSNGKAERKCEYVADFVYEEDGKTHVIDVKGYKQSTAYAVFAIKRKLMLWIHRIEVTEV